MKKILIIFILLCPLINYGQTVSLFSGLVVARQNNNNLGYWYGVYGEIPIYKGLNYNNLSLIALASQSSYKSNDQLSTYKGESIDLGLGLAYGKWFEFFSSTHSSYLSFSSMLKSSFDKGEGRSFTGLYESQQNDYILQLGANWSLIKSYGFNEKLLPKTELRLQYQIPISSNKEDYWNEFQGLNPIAWSKEAQLAQLKQSWFKVGLMTEVHFKTVHEYSYYKGDKSSWLGNGVELSVNKWQKNDFLQLYFVYKQNLKNAQPLQAEQFVFGINIII